MKNSKNRRKSRGSQRVPCAQLPRPSPSAALATAQGLGMAGGPDGLDHLEHALAHPGFADFVVGADQFEGLALDQRVLFLLERSAGLAEAALAAASRHRPSGQRIGRHFVEEVRHRHVENSASSYSRLDPMRFEPRSYFWIC